MTLEESLAQWGKPRDPLPGITISSMSDARWDALVDLMEVEALGTLITPLIILELRWEKLLEGVPFP